MTRPLRASGQVILIALVFFAVFMAVAAAAVSTLTTTEKRMRLDTAHAQALALAEGGLDNAIDALNKNPLYTGETGTALGAGTFSVTVTPGDGATKNVAATGYIPNGTNPIGSATVRATLSTDTTVVSFHYGVQIGDGGLSMAQSSSIVGNVYSDGPIVMSNSSSIDGDAVSAGATGAITGSGNTITGSASAHTLSHIEAGTEAYYAAETNVLASGVACPNAHCHDGSPDPDAVALPISDDQITAWELSAAGGGTIASCDGSGNYVIDADRTLGPVKIACNVVLSGSAELTLAGPLWVVGNVTATNSSGMRIASSLGSLSVPVIADNPANRSSGSIISLSNTGQFEGSGAANSYVLFVSQNRSAEVGGATDAVLMTNSATGLVLYAGHGRINLTNSVHLREVTAYALSLRNSVQVTYDSGLGNARFSSGPGGSWAFAPGSYGVKP